MYRGKKRMLTSPMNYISTQGKSTSIDEFSLRIAQVYIAMEMRSKVLYSSEIKYSLRMPVVKMADYRSATSVLKDRKKMLKKLYKQTQGRILLR